jgi:hypothetical protein
MREIKRLDEINIRNEKDVDIVMDLVKYEKPCKDLRRRNHSILGSLVERDDRRQSFSLWTYADKEKDRHICSSCYPSFISFTYAAEFLIK